MPLKLSHTARPYGETSLSGEVAKLAPAPRRCRGRPRGRPAPRAATQASHLVIISALLIKLSSYCLLTQLTLSKPIVDRLLSQGLCHSVTVRSDHAAGRLDLRQPCQSVLLNVKLKISTRTNRRVEEAKLTLLKLPHSPYGEKRKDSENQAFILRRVPTAVPQT